MHGEVGKLLWTISYFIVVLGLSAYGFPLMTDASAFAADIVSLLASREARAERMALAREFAAAELTSEVYDAKWRSLAGQQPVGSPAEEAADDTPDAAGPAPRTLEAA